MTVAQLTFRLECTPSPPPPSCPCSEPGVWRLCTQDTAPVLHRRQLGVRTQGAARSYGCNVDTDKELPAAIKRQYVDIYRRYLSELVQC